MRPARTAVVSLALLLALAAQAQAQDASRMSCEGLWLARNQLYAKLAPEEAREVSVLQSWERRRGCSG